MKIFKVAVVAACYALALIFTGARAYADDNTPVMGVLDKAGLAKHLSKAGINVYGYAEAGWFYDATSPRKGSGPAFIGYNNFKSDVTLDKVDLSIERMVDATKKQFDVGFHAEGIYGADAAFIHSNGLWDTQTGHDQWDLLQAYADAAFPYIPLRLRVGKWIELAGFEQFSANIYGAFGDPMRALYSYSYQFIYAEPGTQTGAFATYVFNPQWTVDAGFTWGWNQSLRDANHAIDFLGRATFTPSDKTTAIFVMTEGPEFPITVGHNMPAGDTGDYWTAMDLVITHKINDKLSLGLGTDYVIAPAIPGLTTKPKAWGGMAGYASYAVDPHFTLNTRLEWYKDAADGFSTATPVAANFYELTAGVAIKPFPKDSLLSHFIMRPEIRYDHADRSLFSTGKRDQLTFGLDGLVTF